MEDVPKRSIRNKGALRLGGRVANFSAAILALAMTAAAQSFCNSGLCSKCEAHAKSDYTVCLHDNPKGSTICSKGLHLATAACQKQFGVCSSVATCQNGGCGSGTSNSAGE